MNETGHNGQLQSILERLNNLEDQRKEVGEDIREVFAEAKGNGYNPKALRVVLRKQREDKAKAAELAIDVDAYMAALGMV